jgi:hypothetical protein
MRIKLFVLLVFMSCAQAGNGRYLTWIDDQGRVHNTFVDEHYAVQQRQAERRIEAGEQKRGRGWTSGAVAESKRRYFTWVDASGNLHNSVYSGAEEAGQDNKRLRSGEAPTDYIDADVLEGRSFVRSEHGTAYYTWIDDQGRMHNSPMPEGAERTTAPAPITFTEGRQVEFARATSILPGLDGQPSPALQALLKRSQARDGGPYQALLERCCTQLSDSAFTELAVEEPRYQELSRFSPSLQFPMGRSYYAALSLPRSQHTYGLRVRSFANKQLVYPSLLFLDEAKRPTRLVSDAVYQLHPETWYRYAFIEGTVPVHAGQGERYVLLLTTDEDRALRTLDNKPFNRPLQRAAIDSTGLQTHRHVDYGEFELAIIR